MKNQHQGTVCTNRLMMTLGQIGLEALQAKLLARRVPARTAELYFRRS